MAKLLVIACLGLVTIGCWNGRNTHMSLGDVSIGQQMIDLKAALDQGAMTKTEYNKVRLALLAIDGVCENTNSD